MRILFTITLLTCITIAKGQSAINWDGKYQLQLTDFQSSATQVGQGDIFSLHSGSSFGFLFSMSNVEFMFTKNFNSKVSCTFARDAASLVAPDSVTAGYLIEFAQYEFDLSELYARKLRKKLFEEKGTFSNANFFRPVYDQVQKEFTDRSTIGGQVTSLGRNSEKLKELRQEVLNEIEGLSDYCKTCKPDKRKK